ncbi:aldehyde dehydrogenase family protein [Amycolatopsis japonica]|uniref:aldehyde dehydrogenase family protein n=1 Tax=Amycolatopsis japonica TaxID=208439 RepID=UPI0033F3219B
MTTALPHARHFIDGGWYDSARTGTSTGPATGEALGTFADGGREEAKAAVEAARVAFERTSWPRDRQARATALLRLADRLETRRDDLVSLLAKENGKTLGEAAFEVDMCAPKLRYAAALALVDSGRSAEVRPGYYSGTLLEPIGVAGVIVPWNSPVVLAVRSFAPALAAGCTVAMKMPAQTALVNGILAEVIADTPELPPGVINLFTESGDDGARELVSSPGTAVISYTGSTAVGRVIMAEGARTLKRLSLELGGKTPMIVFDDADLDAAVPVLTAAVTTFAGQFCMTGSRILAHEAIAAQLRERLVETLSAVRLGPGDDPDSQMGPMIDRASVDRVDRIVQEAARTATVLVRGGPVEDGPLAGGAYYRPSLLEPQGPDDDIVKREVFGPVATFEVFRTEEEAARLANGTEFGLAASVWTTNADRPLRLARELKAGTVWTNAWAVVHDQFEEGGFGQSGLGRLNGPRSLEAFQEIKHLVRVAPAVAQYIG